MRIHQLETLVAQRIAAGEVIERPASVVRELLDNAIDAKADNISLIIKDGGLDEITVIDDGSGIQKEDLNRTCKSHSTSKINNLDDLYHLDSMGFRGEALYSIASVSRIEIGSSYEGADAYTYTVDNGEEKPISAGGPDKGTKVSVYDLFSQLPARRQFLKRPSSEATLCKNIMIEKAVAFPSITFRYYKDSKLILTLEATDQKKRVCDTLLHDAKFDKSQVLELNSEADRYRIQAIAGSPLIRRSDRGQIKIYINKRPINNYALTQAVSYGYGELLPGGSYPYCYLFLTIDPTLVDFNIHPTKREAKIRIQSEVHHGITQLIKTQMIRPIPEISTSEIAQGTFDFPSQLKTAEAAEVRNQENRNNPTTTKMASDGGGASHNYQGFHAQNTAQPKNARWLEKAKEILNQSNKENDEEEIILDDGEIIEKDPTPSPQNYSYEKENPQQEEKESYVGEDSFIEPELKYIGQAFHLFLIVERGDELYLIDQHAAHERILYDRIRNHSGSQRLLVPYDFEVDPDVDIFLQENSDLYANMGIELIRLEEQRWALQSVPSMYKPVEAEIVSLIKSNTGSTEEIEKGLFAIIACKSAIKKGDSITDVSAKELIKQVFQLEDPACPHGRTFLIKLKKEELEKMVGRT